jgi:hypothetical protein
MLAENFVPASAAAAAAATAAAGERDADSASERSAARVKCMTEIGDDRRKRSLGAQNYSHTRTAGNRSTNKYQERDLCMQLKLILQRAPVRDSRECLGRR